MSGMKFRNIGAIAMSLAVIVMATAPAEARRGGSFGSRGSRTAAAPPPTATAPNQAAPVQRTMTEKPAAAPATASNARPAANTPNRFGGMAKGLIGGLIAGGLIGMLLGNGFGALNGSGILMALLQVALIGGLVWFGLRIFRRRRPALATASAPGMTAYTAAPFNEAPQASSPAPAKSQYFARPSSRDLAITMNDKTDFERLLTDVQTAFSREDYAGLRACTTPEVMSYLAEELSQNATRGHRNEVTGTELLNAEVAEAWSEGDTDYATIAMEYQSIDVMRDRTSGALIEGDPTHPTRATELWTFTRDTAQPWRLSAIQQA